MLSDSATPSAKSPCSISTPEFVCATLPPESPSPTPTPEPVHTKSTAYYYITPEGRRLYPDTSSLTPYKPLPEGWDESEHYWLYGWPASNRKLQDILFNYFDLSDVSTGSFNDASLVLRILEQLSGYRHITRLTCKPSVRAQKEGIVENISGALGIPLLAVSCTARRRFFMQRPTVEQLRYLSSILGEPRWLESWSVKEDFPLDIVR